MEYCMIMGIDKEGRLLNCFVTEQYNSIDEFWSDPKPEASTSLGTQISELAQGVGKLLSKTVSIETQTSPKIKQKPGSNPKIGSKKAVDRATTALNNARAASRAALQAEKLARASLQSIADVHDIREGRQVGTTFRARSRQRSSSRNRNNNQTSQQRLQLPRRSRGGRSTSRNRSSTRNTSRSSSRSKNQTRGTPRGRVRQIGRTRYTSNNKIYKFIYMLLIVLLTVGALGAKLAKPISKTEKPNTLNMTAYEVQFNQTIEGFISQETDIDRALSLAQTLRRKGKEYKSDLVRLSRSLDNFLVENKALHLKSCLKKRKFK